jgi:hypothetical protein
VLASHTGTFVIDHVEQGRVEHPEPAQVESANYEQDQGRHVRGLPTESVRRACVDWSGKCMWHVDQVFPCRVYIDSNRHDSQI